MEPLPRVAIRNVATGPLAGVAIGAAYGILARLVFRFPTVVRAGPLLENMFGVMTIAFLFVVPIGLGALTVAFLPAPVRRSVLAWILLPWLACVGLLAGVVVTLLEGAICVVMAAPIFFFFSSVGGVISGLISRNRERRAPAVVIALLPFVLSPLELRTPPPAEERTVVTERLVRASPEALWPEVVRVREIRPEEVSTGFFGRIGIPQPLEATLDRDGAGALRTARFRGGIVFLERVEIWDPGRRLGFTIRVVPESIAPGALDEHVRVGTERFDVTWGEFRLEPLAGGSTRLVLSSRHRLATRFNAYAGFWTDAVMRDLQARICAVIAARAETKRAALGPPAGLPRVADAYRPATPSQPRVQ